MVSLYYRKWNGMYMERKGKYLLLILLSIIFMPRVMASTCSDERIMELTSAATNVKVNYELIEETTDDYEDELTGEQDHYTFNTFYVTIHNLTDDLNAVVSREDTKKSVLVTSKDQNDDGVVYIKSGEPSMIKNYIIKIRSNDSNCQNEVLKTATVTVPVYNKFYRYQTCTDYPDYDLCKEYTSTDYNSLTDYEFNKKIEKYKEEKQEEEKRQSSIAYKVGQFLQQYGIYIIIVLIILIAAIVYYLIRRKKRRLV